MKSASICAAALSALLALPVQAAGITPVGPMFAIGTAQAPALGSSVAMRADGSFAVAWYSRAGVFAQRYATGGVPQGAAITVYTPPAGKDVRGQPTLSMNAAGDFALAWVVEESDNVAVRTMWARVYRADGTPLGTAFRCDDDTHPLFANADRNHALALDDADHALAAWSATVPGKTGLLNGSPGVQGLYLRRFTAAGAALDAAAQEISGAGTLLSQIDSLSASAADDGHYLVSWSASSLEVITTPSPIGSHQTVLQPAVVHLRQIDSSGRPKGAVATVLSSAEEGEGMLAPRTAMNGSGEFALAWAGQRPLAANFVHSQAYSAAGVVKAGAGVDVPRALCCNNSNPVVAIDAAGDYVAAYADRLRVYMPGRLGNMQPLSAEFSAALAITGAAMGSGNQFVVVGADLNGAEDFYGQLYSFSS